MKRSLLKSGESLVLVSSLRLSFRFWRLLVSDTMSGTTLKASLAGFALVRILTSRLCGILSRLFQVSLLLLQHCHCWCLLSGAAQCQVLVLVAMAESTIRGARL